MVIKQKIIEILMGYRGSKSVGWSTRVGWYYWKEQRIYGGTYKRINIFYIRYILTDFERNCQIINLFYQRNNQKKLYSLYAAELLNNGQDPNKENLSWFICGLVDAEGSFTIATYKDRKNRIGWGVKLVFKIVLHKKDKALLEQIKSYFGVGNISKDGDILQYRVESIKDLPKIVQFFDKYQLITKKHADCLLFKQAVNLALNKEHIKTEGLQKIVAIKASMNRRNLSPKLKEAFPNIIPVDKPNVLNAVFPIPHPQWLAGFTSGEGCFFIVIYKSESSKLKEAVQLKFILVQHVLDEQLMRNIKKYLECGNLLKKRDTLHFTVENFQELTKKIIPFFQKFPILGIKSKDFSGLCKAVELINNKAHLTKEGLYKIKKIKIVPSPPPDPPP